MKNSSITILALISVILVGVFSCEKQKREETVTAKSDAVPTFIYINSEDVNARLAKINQGINAKVTTACTPDAYTYKYIMTTDCNGPAFSLQEIRYLNNVQPTNVSVKINGVSFGMPPVTYVGYQQLGIYKYKLEGISFSSVGISSFCNSPSLYVEYFACGELVAAETIPVDGSANCSGSWQPAASSPSAGYLNMYLPTPFCPECVTNLAPPYYQFRYRLTTISTWTTTAQIANPTYFTGTTVSGLTSGDYYVEGRNACSASQTGPWVPIPNSGDIIHVN
jgi:hypothetical protein